MERGELFSLWAALCLYRCGFHRQCLLDFLFTSTRPPPSASLAQFSFSDHSFKLSDSLRCLDTYMPNCDFFLSLPGRFALEPVHLLAPVIRVGGLNLSERRRREKTCREVGSKRHKESEKTRWLWEELVVSADAPCGTTQIWGVREIERRLL